MKRLLHAAGWVGLAIGVAATVLMVLPLQPNFLEAGLDTGFHSVLHYAAMQPAAERPRLIGTYGPLGFTFSSLYLPETYPRVLAVQTVLAGVLCWALAWLGWAAWRSPWGGALLLLASAPLVGPGDSRSFLLVALVALIELVPTCPPPRPLRLALGLALGFLALMKVTFVSAGAMVLAPLALSALQRRRLPLVALTALATVAASWVLLDLGWDEWVAYLDWSLREITPGYSQAMQYRATTLLVWHAVAVSGALLVWISLLAWRRLRHGWWAPPLAAAGVLFLQFKAGFVRADVHVFITAFALLLEGLALAVLLGRRGAALGALLVVALPGALLVHTLITKPPPNTSYRFPSPSDLAARLAALRTLVSADGFTTPHAQHVRDLRSKAAMPPFDGGVDMFGHWQGWLVGNESPYRPRPVFQSYMAYTPRLAHENADFLVGTAAPRWLLFHPETIDGRFPALDDAASWPLLLSLYQPAGGVGRFALLERRPAPRAWRLVPLGGADALTDKPITVPSIDGGAIWARIDVQETSLDRLQTLLFAAPYQYADVVYITDAVWRARLVPAIARDGFLLSPVVTTVPGFVALATQGPQAIATQAVREIRVHVDSPFGEPVTRAVHVDFARLEIAPAP